MVAGEHLRMDQSEVGVCRLLEQRARLLAWIGVSRLPHADGFTCTIDLCHILSTVRELEDVAAPPDWKG